MKKDFIVRRSITMVEGKPHVETYSEQELVRCKDCKHRPTDPENKGFGQYLEFPDDVCPCQIGDICYSWMPEDNWFCADGERKLQEENV